MEKKKLVKKMNNKNCFFLTNDDGYRAIGLKYLKKTVKQISNDIWVFAPAKNQSAKSHSITINKNINIRMASKREYIIKGTPSDCVIFGLAKKGQYDEYNRGGDHNRLCFSRVWDGRINVE